MEVRQSDRHPAEESRQFLGALLTVARQPPTRSIESLVSEPLVRLLVEYLFADRAE